ncbi:MAG: ribonuclease E/G, partial [Crocosphaera sp.]
DNEGPGELELLHHPSYQEQNSNANNRRRRRRQTPNIVIKEDTAKPSNNVVTKEAEENKESGDESRRERLPRHLRREETPVERVSVEMTPLEQDVYALMGISPLVRLDQEIKDPKSVVVSVKSPEGVERKTVAKTIQNTEETETPDTTQQQMVIDLTGINTIPATEPVTVEPTQETDNNDEDNQEDEIIDAATEDEGPKPVIRRRRRRSSAKDSDE